MQGVLLGLASLACPVGMGLMMWIMARGQRRDNKGAGARPAWPVSCVDPSSQVAALLADIEVERAARPGLGGGEVQLARHRRSLSPRSAQPTSSACGLICEAVQASGSAEFGEASLGDGHDRSAPSTCSTPVDAPPAAVPRGS